MNFWKFFTYSLFVYTKQFILYSYPYIFQIYKKSNKWFFYLSFIVLNELIDVLTITIRLSVYFIIDFLDWGEGLLYLKNTLVNFVKKLSNSWIRIQDDSKQYILFGPFWFIVDQQLNKTELILTKLVYFVLYTKQNFKVCILNLVKIGWGLIEFIFTKGRDSPTYVVRPL